MKKYKYYINNKLIGDKLQKADTFFLRLKGLLGRKKLEPAEGLLITPCKQIHTNFMKFPIDVVYLTKTFKVIETISELEPWNNSKKIIQSVHILELPKGTIKRCEITPGQRVKIG